MGFQSSRLVVVTLAFLAASSRAEPLLCPSEKVVQLSASAPGWSANWYPNSTAPQLAFEGVWMFPHESVECRYKVEGRALVSLRNYRSCAPARGVWKEQGITRLCQAAAPEECALECGAEKPK